MLGSEHQKSIEPLLTEFIGKPLTIIPILEQNCQEIREEYVRKQKQSSDVGSVFPAGNGLMFLERKHGTGNVLFTSL
ncbi:UNVERIFIED_CONTAM: hypothetical protein N8J90_07070 [Halobacillus marinus]